jgi:hypothetical protein
VLFIPAVSTAEVYTWTDDQGVAHFTDIKPEAREHQTVEIRRPSMIPMRENISRGERVSTINRQTNRSLETSDGGSRKTASRQDARELERKKSRCAGYRERLERIQQKLRAGYSNDQGNRLRRQRREVSQKLSRECLLG